MHSPDTSPLDDSPLARVLAQGYRKLRFPEPLERQFREEHRVGAHRFVRMSLLVALITSTGFALIDHLVINATNTTPNLARFGLQFPVLLICCLAAFRRFYLRWYEPAIRIGLPLFGLGTVVMMTYTPENQMALIGARLLLVTFFCYFMLGLRMQQALVANLAVFTCLLVVGVLGLVPPNISWYLSFAMFCANIIGAVGAYALEHAGRTAFLERLSLEEVAARDGLTRLLNRQTFEYRARGLWRAADTVQRSVAVVMIDVDYFKRYNDHYGHQAGDACLRQIAAIVRDSINPGPDELVARYGGEELIALLVNRSDEEIEKTVRSVVDNIGSQGIPHAASVVCGNVTVSVGATRACALESLPFPVLANLADKALYSAKHLGRNRYTMIDAQAAGELTGNISVTEGITRPEARPALQPTYMSLSASS
jgi:diguanylate cyclase (GGDEF)-like protein